MADAVAEAQEVHATARRDPTGSARAFLNEAVLPAVRALNRAGAPTLLPAMHLIVNAVQLGLISPEAALYGHWMEWRESNRSGRPLSMGDTLWLTGAGSAMSLRSSAPALLHALRTRYPGDAAPYLNQARATYPGGVSELDAALRLPYPPDVDLEVGEVTVFVEGADEASDRPRPTDLVYDGTRPTAPCTPSSAWRSPGSPLGAPPSRRRRTRPAAGLTQTCAPPLQNQECPPQGAGPLARVPWHPPAPPRRRDPRGPGADPGDHPHPPLWDGVHTFLRTQEVTAVTGAHLVRLPPTPLDDPWGPRALGPAPDWELWRDAWAAWLPRLPSQCRWMAAGPRPCGADATASPPPPPPLPPAEHHTALPTARH